MDPSYNPWATPIFPNHAAFGTGSPQEDAQRAPNLLDNLLSKIAGAAGRAFMAPGQALQSTTPITTEQMIKPAADIAGSMTLGAGAIPADLNALRMGIKAYHGSPHDFDRFDINRIGTGEGAQAYGHGLYFAENEGVARAYKKNLAAASADIAPSWKGDGWQVTTRDGGNFDRQFFPTKAEAEAHAAKFNKGHMYEVNLHADPAHLLDWDKPLAQQHPNIQRSVNAELAGGDVNDLRNYTRAGGDKELAQAGIPGIKYLDQGSRGAGQGSSNYVMFDDKLIDILRKYGIAGMTAPPIFAGAMSEQKQ